MSIFSALSGCHQADSSSAAAEASKTAQNDEAVTAPSSSLPMTEATVRVGDECCTDPGAIAACWWEDARRDGATCLTDDDCPGASTCNKEVRYGEENETPPNGWGLCTCSDDNDCQAGGRDGVCADIDGESLCAPSFCNGYLVCACIGGCTEGQTGGYASPGEMCAATDEGFPGECCDGGYPEDPSGGGFGYCSGSCGGSTGGAVCEEDADCTGEIPDPYSEDCARFVCDEGACRIDYMNSTDTCADNVQLGGGEGDYWGDGVRDESGGVLSCFVGFCSSAGRCMARTAEADNLLCDDDDGNPCTDEVCVGGACTHDFEDNVGQPCNVDGDACTLDECDAAGVCAVGAAMDCDDSNLCTYPDGCVDNDPDHIAALCENPAVDGNATDFGYTDTSDCEDLICVDGVETTAATDCSAYNPDGYDLQCNSYLCVDGNGEDNCTLSYLSEVGNICSDGDACTAGDRCVDDGDRGVCEATGDLDCDDANPCTTDSCSGGACTSTPNEGEPCDDGDPCTLNDTCDASGSCVSDTPKDCSSLDNSCTDGVCNAATGVCEPSYLAVGESCDADGNACTVNDVCDGVGACVPGAAKDCSSEDDACNLGECDTGTGVCGKKPRVDGTSCNADNDACTPDDTCQSGVCTADATPVSCAAYSDQCNISVCNSTTGVCEYDNVTMIGAVCNLDNDGCTEEVCDGSIIGDEALTCGANATVTCSDGNQCTDDTCSSTGNYSYTCANPALAAGTSCNADSDGCTANDQCNGSGGCVAGTNIDALTCEGELTASNPLFDADCSTATCVSTGDNSHNCVPAERATNPGDCNADFDACTLDVCGAFDATNGAACTAGAARDCSALDNPPCQGGVCDDFGDFYNSSCAVDWAAEGTSCDADSDGCTEGDACDGAGSCNAGAAVICTPSDSCHTSECSSSGTDSYSCDETLIAGCCEVAEDCIGQGYPCEGGGVCNGLVCNAGVCGCAVLNEGDSCDGELVAADYPQNCYAGICDSEGSCLPEETELSAVPNNLCSDLFDPSDSTRLMSGNVANLGDLGASAADGEMLSATGSTLCGYNNYRASADNNCTEKADGADLGILGSDVVYSFRYWTPSTTDHELYSYVVKVEADFDVGVYLQDGIADAQECPEGNNPDQDESSNATTRGEGYISYEVWTGYSGTSLTGQPPSTAADYIGWYDSFQAPSDWLDSYVQRVRGYLIAPTTGSYTFWISGDDNCELYLSTDDASSNKVLIATVPGWTPALQWDKFPVDQKSVAIDLTAGEKYYIEALQKEGTGGDNLAVGWAKPGEFTTAPSEVVPGSQLSPWDGNDTPTGSGTISYEQWNSVSGSDVTSIPVTTTPSATGTYTSFEAPSNAGRSFGMRIRGYLTAPFTGDYTFFVAADDQGELWLSTDFDPANKVLLVRTDADAAPRDWTADPDQKSAAVSLVRGQKYYIEGLYKENKRDDNFAVGWAKPGESTSTASGVIPGKQLSPWDGGPKSGYGYMSYEKWNGISGGDVSDIPLGTTPDESGIHVSLYGIPVNWGDNYGQRIYGYIMAPLTGSYTFWVSGDDTAELWLSTDENPANKVRIASVPAWTNYNEWNKYSDQKSSAVNLEAGEYYYMEILHKEANGGDHVMVGWAKPGQSTSSPSEVIEEHQIAPWGLHDYEDISDPTGNICFDMWLGKYYSVTDTPTSKPPDISGAYDSFDGLSNWDGYPFFSQRIRGFLVPPTTGNYTFWLSADDNATMYLSTDENPANLVEITSVVSAVYPYEWDRYSAQQSASIPLIAGNRYYVEVRHTDWYGRDHVQVGWAKPGESTRFGPTEVVPGAYLDPLDGGCGNGSVDIGWVCQNPYTDSSIPAVVEEECSTAFDSLNGQACCDPCDTSCYNQCERGYRVSDDALCSLCDGDCERTWEAPEAPFDCTAEKPSDSDYDAFTDMALAVITPKPADGGAWRNVIVYVDGSAGEAGNFYLTVEKRKQPASVCERVSDSPRIIDVTDASSSGSIYSSTLENLVNSRHVTSGDTSCGGYDCTEEWVADGSCHSSSDTPNAFWPAWEGYKILRDSSSMTYCVTAAPAASNGLDPVVTIMESSSVEDPCFATLTNNTCAHANHLSTQSQIEFTASPGTLYLIEVSRYEGLSHPCFNDAGDDCNYTLTVNAGACP